MWITALNWKGNTKCSESIHLSLQFMVDHSFESIILTKSKVQFFLNFKISYKVCTIILCWMLSRPIMIIYRIFMNFPSAIHLNASHTKGIFECWVWVYCLYRYVSVCLRLIIFISSQCFSNFWTISKVVWTYVTYVLCRASLYMHFHYPNEEFFFSLANSKKATPENDEQKRCLSILLLACFYAITGR